MKHRTLHQYQLLMTSLLTLSALSEGSDSFCFDDKYTDGSDDHDNSISSITTLDNGKPSTNWPFSGKTIQVDLGDIKRRLTESCGDQISWPKPGYDDCPNFMIYSDTYCAKPGYIKEGIIRHDYRTFDDTTGLNCVKNMLSNYDCSGIKIVDVKPDLPFLLIMGTLSFLACCTCILLIKNKTSQLESLESASTFPSNSESSSTLASLSLLANGSPDRYDIENPEIEGEELVDLPRATAL